MEKQNVSESQSGLEWAWIFMNLFISCVILNEHKRPQVILGYYQLGRNMSKHKSEFPLLLWVSLQYKIPQTSNDSHRIAWYQNECPAANFTIAD